MRAHRKSNDLKRKLYPAEVWPFDEDLNVPILVPDQHGLPRYYNRKQRREELGLKGARRSQWYPIYQEMWSNVDPSR